MVKPNILGLTPKTLIIVPIFTQNKINLVYKIMNFHVNIKLW